MKNIFPAIVSLMLLSLPARSVEQNIFVDTDPFPLFQGGGQVSVGIRYSHFRFATFLLETDESPYVDEQDSFEARSRDVGGWLGFGTSDGEGPFGAVEFRRTRIRLANTTTNSRIRRDVDLLGLKFGYQHNYGKYFFLRPQLGLLKNLNRKSPMVLDGVSNDVEENVLIWGMHLGVRF